MTYLYLNKTKIGNNTYFPEEIIQTIMEYIPTKQIKKNILFMKHPFQYVYSAENDKINEENVMDIAKHTNVKIVVRELSNDAEYHKKIVENKKIIKYVEICASVFGVIIIFDIILFYIIM
jgi:hypothetical protein